MQPVSLRDIVDPAKVACREWGRQKARMLGSDAQGWSGKSLIARFQDLHDGSGARTQRLVQFREEGHIGDGLLVARAIQGDPPRLAHMPIHLYNPLFVHYVFHGKKAPDKARLLGVTLSQYWLVLGNAEVFVASRLPAFGHGE